MGEAAVHYPHLARCSPGLTTMTAAVEAWGRARWPGARVIHEMKVGGCRLDLAFVQPTHLIGVELKSERDTLDRLDTQIRHFCREIPEMWVAVAPKWLPRLDDLRSGVGRIIVDRGAIEERIPLSPRTAIPRPANNNVMLTAPMLHLLWRAEARSLARQHGVSIPSKMPLYDMVKVLARRLTGDQIVAGVCEALRSREITRYSDAPLLSTGAPDHA